MFPDVIFRDAGIVINDLGTVMKDREVWKSLMLRTLTNKLNG